MSRYLLVRGALAVFVVLVVTLLVAWAVRLSGDPAVMLAEGLVLKIQGKRLLDLQSCLDRLLLDRL